MNEPREQLNRRIRTALYRDQRFSSAELDLLHTPSLQRLYDLRQLGFADRVFVDASHTRLAHVLGVMEIASYLCNSIARNLAAQAKKRGPFKWTAEVDGTRQEHSLTSNDLVRLVEKRRQPIRLIALLHDLTHAPFGHTLEDEIQLVHPAHDDPDRQADAFLRLLMEYLIWTAVECRSSIVNQAWDKALKFDAWLEGDGDIAELDADKVVALGTSLLDHGARSFGRTRLSPDEFADLLIDLNFSTRALYYLEVSHKYGRYKAPAASYLVNDLIERMLRGSRQNATAQAWAAEESAGVDHSRKFALLRDAYCVDLIGNTICADLLDYANRDAVNTGLPLSFDVARIVEHFTLVSYVEEAAKEPHPFHGTGLRAAVEFSNAKFRGDVIGELMQLLQVRYYIYERALYHPTKCVAGAMLGRAVQLLGFSANIPLRWQLTGDAVFLEELGQVSRLILDATEAVEDTLPQKSATPYSGEVAQKIISQLRPGTLPVLDCARSAIAQRELTLGGLKNAYAGEMPGAVWMSLFLYNSGKLKPHGEVLALETLPEILKRPKWHTPDPTERKKQDAQSVTAPMLEALAGEAATVLAAKNPQLGKQEALSLAQAAFSKIIPSIADTREQVKGARRLAARLAARRYAKRIYCLLPRNIQGNDISLERPKIAQRFLNPHVRMAAEQTIERMAELPPGSVVIHCPPATGPKKLAQVIVTYNQPEETATPGIAPESRRRSTLLRSIGSIDGPAKEMFKAHEDHVHSMEQMYASMWRLWVAVTPPLDKEYQSLGKIISQAMSAAMFSGGHNNAVNNDAFMVEELRDLYSDTLDETGPEKTAVAAEAKPDAVRRAADTGDRAMTVAEITAILEPYLATFSAPRRKEVLARMDRFNVIGRLASRSMNPDFREQFERFRIREKLTAASWDARDIDDFVRFIQQWTNVEIDFTLEHPVHRRLHGAERPARMQLSREIARKIHLKDVTLPSGAIRIAELIRRDKGVKVIFQPLLTAGLYASSDTGHVIYVNSEQHLPSELQAIFNSGEAQALLPARIRFTLAHEYMHHLIATQDDPIFREQRDPARKNDITEIMCQELAAEALISNEVIERVCRENIFDPRKLDAACVSLGVNIRPMIIRLSESDSMENHTHGIAVIYCSRDETGDLLNIRCAASRAITGPIETLRNLATHSALPFQDILSHEMSGEKDVAISSSSTIHKYKELVTLKMLRSPTGSPSSTRLVVVVKK